jgi:hypothetical protein
MSRILRVNYNVFLKDKGCALVDTLQHTCKVPFEEMDSNNLELLERDLYQKLCDELAENQRKCYRDAHDYMFLSIQIVNFWLLEHIED